jgi:hypothetical protein
MDLRSLRNVNNILKEQLAAVVLTENVEIDENKSI